MRRNVADHYKASEAKRTIFARARTVHTSALICGPSLHPSIAVLLPVSEANARENNPPCALELQAAMMLIVLVGGSSLILARKIQKDALEVRRAGQIGPPLFHFLLRVWWLPRHFPTPLTPRSAHVGHPSEGIDLV